jgi:hypothetical protein
MFPLKIIKILVFFEEFSGFLYPFLSFLRNAHRLRKAEYPEVWNASATSNVAHDGC